jgi:hypothetical protein
MIEGMKGIIGVSGTQAVMVLWELQDCLDKPEEFHDKLYLRLKQPGTGVLERAIAKELFRAIGETYSPSERSFEDSISSARKLYLLKGKQ